MRNNYYQEQQTSQKNYRKNRRSYSTIVSAQIVHRYNDEQHIREDPETDGNREKEAGATIGLPKEESNYVKIYENICENICENTCENWLAK
jgi:hypothetical protein